MLIQMEFQGGKCNFNKMVFNLKKLKKQGGKQPFSIHLLSSMAYSNNWKGLYSSLENKLQV